MFTFRRSIAVFLLLLCSAVASDAQGPPPRIGPYVVDVRAAFPRFPTDAAVAESRGLAQAELPRGAIGIDVNAHVYVMKWKAVTVGLGGQLLHARAHTEASEGGREVRERLTVFTPQLSLNFGSGDGWSYISGGIGPSIWSIVPDGAQPLPADEERLRTYNYGGGARWFTRRHLAVHFDLRFHVIAPGTPSGALPGSPAVNLLVLGAGVSLKP